MNFRLIGFNFLTTLISNKNQTKGTKNIYKKPVRQTGIGSTIPMKKL
jgi:hypothetical protein